MAPLDIAVRLGVPLLLGRVIGLQRQWRQRMPGLRTNALVLLGATGFVVFSATVSGDSSPAQLAAQIVSTIRFLGRDVILRPAIAAPNECGRHGLDVRRSVRWPIVPSPVGRIALVCTYDRNASARSGRVTRLSLRVTWSV